MYGCDRIVLRATGNNSYKVFNKIDRKLFLVVVVIIITIVIIRP